MKNTKCCCDNFKKNIETKETYIISLKDQLNQKSDELIKLKF